MLEGVIVLTITRLTNVMIYELFKGLSTMFGLGRRRQEKLEAKFKVLLEESFQLSHLNCVKSEEIAARASEIWKELEQLRRET